ncbi:L,D-transpeptidase family protein [Rhodobium gokarnense]|uniref:Murein L,D-transpeptidase YcbB/YkuD n=1 Tax=Rhodobium gokarnense TaxID=364296 RepID=A0ABT3HFL2_9HYPH|nr:L,D-transpeptidase family protein [Rhodobium gokarnense]MCW2309134.1 murein L,D-transpeptidase YcbB/YkuD [Rhodobium gokarnense]
MAKTVLRNIGTAGLLVGIFTMVPGGPVHAQSFLDRLFNPKYYKEDRQKPEPERKKVKVRISSPRYYTYKPDSQQLFSFSELTKVPERAPAPLATLPEGPAAAPALPGDEALSLPPETSAPVETEASAVPTEDMAAPEANAEDLTEAAIDDAGDAALPETTETIGAADGVETAPLPDVEADAADTISEDVPAAEAADAAPVDMSDPGVALLAAAAALRGDDAASGETVAAPAAVAEADPAAEIGPAADADAAGETPLAAELEPAATQAGPVADATPTGSDGVDTEPTGSTVTAAPVETASPAIAEAVRPADFDAARPLLADFKLRTLPEVAKAMKAHYAEAEHFLWVDADGVNEKAEAALAALAKADRFGLLPDDYAVELPNLAENADEEARERELLRFEFALTSKVLLYVLDAERGRVDPNRISGYHDLPRKKVDLEAALADIEGSDDVSTAIASHHPDNDTFRAMVEKLAALRAADEATRVEIDPTLLLKPGQSSEEVANIVAAIKAEGSEELAENHAATLAAYDGGPDYTPELVALVKDYQKERKLTVDGIVGPSTVRSLVGVSNAAKIEKIELAMERLRWLPEAFGRRHVFINQAAFTATYSEEGRDPLTMRVVVGKKSNQTSFFTDKIETVEYNPYWGVPLSIIVNEMVPKLNKDPSYLDRAGYEVSTVGGRAVSSASVDWYAVATQSQSINVRQRPGSSNALGAVKILFPNKHHIYMHDTPAKSLFKHDRRAFSHGCIRLQHPRLMAAAVLGKSQDYVSSRIAPGVNESESVRGDIPVYVAYFTAWPKAGGDMGYYFDVYDRDLYLQKALARTHEERDANG